MDHSNTKVLLIGVSEFPEDETINAIPNVLANVELLRSSLVNTELIGVPESNITVSINEDKGQIERKLLGLVNSTRDKKSTLIIYYSGHGILSSTDFKLYLTTHRTSKAFLEIDGVNIDVLKNYIKRSRADRKIVILDCCHSGAFIDYSMSSLESIIQADINDFIGTYIMTSAAGDEPSLFPEKSPEKPTYFTGKLVQILNEGLDNDQQFCSLRDIYDKIEDDFKFEGLPHPQQSNVNDVDQLLFAVNKKYRKKKPKDEAAWDQALIDNTKWAYIDFRNQFPESTFFTQAMTKILELEDEEYWNKALNRANLSAFASYLNDFPKGKHTDEAYQKIAELRQFELSQEENRHWNRVLNNGDLASLENYITRYPKGRYAAQCNEEIIKLKTIEEQQLFEERLKLKQRKEQEQEQQKKEEEAQVQILQREKQSEKERETKRIREQEMAAYEKKEKELEAKRIENERIKELEAKRIEAERIKELEAKRIEAERIKEQELEAKRKEAERIKQEELETKRKEAERIKQQELEAKRKEAERIKEQELAAKRKEDERIEAQKRKDQEIEARKQAEKQRQHELEVERKKQQKLNEEELERKKISAKIKKEQEDLKIKEQTESLLQTPKEFEIKEEIYIEPKTVYSKETIGLIAAIILVVAIFLYIVYKNI